MNTLFPQLPRRFAKSETETEPLLKYGNELPRYQKETRRKGCFRLNQPIT